MRLPVRLLALAPLFALATLPAACGSADDAPVATGDDMELGEGPKLAYDDYQVLFTNPICKPYAYGPVERCVAAHAMSLRYSDETLPAVGSPT